MSSKRIRWTATERMAGKRGMRVVIKFGVVKLEGNKRE